MHNSPQKIKILTLKNDYMVIVIQTCEMNHTEKKKKGKPTNAYSMPEDILKWVWERRLPV